MMKANRIFQMASSDFSTTEEFVDGVCDFIELMCMKPSYVIVEDLDALDAKIAAGWQPSHVNLLSEMSAGFQEAVSEYGSESETCEVHSLPL